MSEQKIINNDCLQEIPKLDNKSIDLVITSPPYNVSLGDNKYHHLTYDTYADNKPHEEYLNWLCEIFSQIMPKLKIGGRIAINVVDTASGKVPLVSDIQQFMLHKLGYLAMGNIIWNKSQINNFSCWGSFVSPSAPAIRFPFEYVLLFAKESRKLQWKGETDLTKEEFIAYANALWSITPETGSKKKYNHPAAFPVELPLRIMKFLSWRNSLIVDPFCGTGSTGVACKQSERNFIGFDISPEYCATAQERLNNV